MDQKNQSRWEGIRKSLGPGLLMAGAAIGGSHLVQSTRAGADYGFALVIFIFLANLFKYPFFEYGPRYTAATGQNLLEGYRRLGNWALYLFIAFTFITMFIIVAALTTVTAGLAGNMLGLNWNPALLSALLMMICISILLGGKYPLLDRITKIIVVILSLSTVVAVIAVLFHGRFFPAPESTPHLWTVGGISFIVALMGWMPSVVDISVWHSLWTLERQKQTNHRPKLKEALIDFNIGYIGTALLAFLFVTLGAMVMNGSGETFSNSTVKFAGQLVLLYTNSLGSWAGPVIAIAAFTTMFSTTLVVTDAYPRVIRQSAVMLFPDLGKNPGNTEWVYRLAMIGIAVVAMAIILFFKSQIKTLIDLATTLSFLTTPVLAYINYKVIRSAEVPKAQQPGTIMRWLSQAGIIFWTVFVFIFLYIKFIR
ncbi:MAG: divalent metal cation transporter [Calditrichia bacterium]